MMFPPGHKRVTKMDSSFPASAFILVLAFTGLLLAGCKNQDPFYSQNQGLIRVLDAQDKITSAAADKYVLRGEGGHLFYLEDLRAAVTKWKNQDSLPQSLRRLSDQLKARNIRLIIVPVPTKVEVHADLLSPGRNAFDVSPAKNALLENLDRLRLECLDLRKDFFLAKNDKRLFPHTDTHWDQDAILLAAERIARMISPPLPADGKPPLSDTLIAGFKGDLAEKFGLAESDTVRLKRVSDGEGGRYREPDSAGIILFGDSFLNQFKTHSAHLGAHLSRESGNPVKTVYSLAGLPKGPARILGLVEAFPGTKAVIWVFTSRSIMEADL